ncbi:MAG: hypothetical protein COA66_02375 [Arcobacter sp.]|nr:MAG: hypothetical protein COA66_02375 [Arcobacter sp.]
MLPLTTNEIIRINTETGPIPVKDFSYFFYLFRAIYVISVKSGGNNFQGNDYTRRDVKYLVTIVAKKIKKFSRQEILESSFTNLDINEDLTIVDIKRENPLDIIFGGISIALAAAVIISGGKFKGPGFKVELPPLGIGIKALKEAFKER